MTNEDIYRIALAQSAEDIGCRPNDFIRDENVIVPLSMGEKARKYYKLPITCNLVSYGSNIVAAVTEEVSDVVGEYLNRYKQKFYHCFEPPNMHWLNDRLAEKGHKICFMAEYYLPDRRKVRALACDYEMKVLEPPDFDELYLPEWSNALCRERKQLDVLGVGAYDNGPEYRRRGIASAVTAGLALEIMERGKVPFYCSAWSNIRSVKNAIKSGFVPAWVEMTAKPVSIVDELNEV